MPISKSALVTATVHQFQNLRLVLGMVYSQEFEFCVQNFFTSLFRNSIFLHSEAWLSSIMQNRKKIAQIPLHSVSDYKKRSYKKRPVDPLRCKKRRLVLFHFLRNAFLKETIWTDKIKKRL